MFLAISTNKTVIAYSPPTYTSHWTMLTPSCVWSVAKNIKAQLEKFLIYFEMDTIEERNIALTCLVTPGWAGQGRAGLGWAGQGV